MKNLFFRYIYQYRFTAFMLVIFSVVFAGVFSLYDLQAEAVIYAGILCAILVVTVIIINFGKFVKDHRERAELLENILIMTEELPEPCTVAEEDYILIIKKLMDANYAASTKYSLERTESVDYYTTWVHQIKTPISVMRMILQSEDTEQNRELLSELFKIEQYAEMVLCYFRLDDNSSDFVFARYELDNIIKKAVRKFASQFIRKRIRLNFKPTEMTVLTDEKWLSFIIEQLLSNAVKYTDRGGITIYAENGILKISDTGIGIAQEDLPRIFEKGFTGYNGRADKKSTGLGLYLCKKAADKLSHKVSVESEVGRGSTFSVDLRTDTLEVE